MPGACTFNLWECGLWLIVSAILVAKSFVEAPRLRPVLRWLALAFLAFGFSDYVEAHIGAWWNPPWLWVLKGGCIAVFGWGFRRYAWLSKDQRQK